METLAAIGALVTGLAIRFGLLLLVMAILAIPALLAATAVRGYALLRPRAAGAMRVGGLWWRDDVYYTPAHTWISRHGRALRIGIDDLAHRVLSGADEIFLPPAGLELRQGEVASRVLCGDKCAAIVSPVDGTVTAVNEAVRSAPAAMRRDPYESGWLFEVKPANSHYRRLPRGERAEKWFRTEARRLMQFLERDLGIAAADGGELVLPAPSLLSPAQWAALTEEFLGAGRVEVVMVRPAEHGRAWRIALVPFMAVGAAIVGGLYVMFFPVIGLAMLLGFSGVWVWQGVRHGVTRLAGRSSGPVRL